MESEKGMLQIELLQQEVKVEDLPADQQIEPGQFALLKVSDTGCGISKDNIDKIFVPYFTTKEKGEGTGLGLAVVHGIVKDGNGFITVASEVDQGTTVSVFFPIHETSDDIQSEHILQEKRKERIPANILIVDDDPLLVCINKRRLQSEGYLVEAFTESVKALEKFYEDPEYFDMIITDQSMPKMTGEELANAVLKVKPSLPIIMCTGHSDIVPKERALAIGITRYVLKPIHENELLDAVFSILKAKQQQ